MTEEQAREFAAWLHGKRAALIVARDTVDRDSELWVTLDSCQRQWKAVQEYLVERNIGVP